MSNFYPFEVVGRGSETQFQMGEKLFVYIAFYELTGYGRFQLFICCSNKHILNNKGARLVVG